MASTRPTLKDVARKCDVSIATVSLVLRDLGKGEVSDATRHRVKEAARKLHYRHNALAAGLRTGTTDVVAFLVHRLSGPQLATKVSAAEAALRQADMRTVVWHTSEIAEVEARALKHIRSQMVRGVVVTYPVHSGSALLLQQLMEEGVPVVALEEMENIPSHVVTVDRAAALHLATEHLLTLGHRRIGITGHSAFLDIESGHGRGYAEALRGHDVQPDPALILDLPGGNTYRAGHAVGLRLVAMADPPTGVVCSDDEVAIGIMRALREAGRRVPEELALVGFDDLPAAEFAEVPLTTVRHPTAEIGRLAAERLLEDIRSDQPGPRQRMILQPELVVRQSCGSPIHNNPSNLEE